MAQALVEQAFHLLILVLGERHEDQAVLLHKFLTESEDEFTVLDIFRVRILVNCSLGSQGVDVESLLEEPSVELGS